MSFNKLAFVLRRLGIRCSTVSAFAGRLWRSKILEDLCRIQYFFGIPWKKTGSPPSSEYLALFETLLSCLGVVLDESSLPDWRGILESSKFLDFSSVRAFYAREYGQIKRLERTWLV